MIKTLTRHGNSLSLVIDRPILDLLRIDQDTPLEISTDGENLVISPVRKDGDRESRRAKIAAILQDADARYGEVFTNLAK
ncbi:MAG: AbrB/MazE/SpoVT family DNA-binding domain-containing protein [Sumerlaeia bacterium]